MALSKESEDALRECLRILARRYPPEQRGIMARNVEQYIQEGKWLPAFAIEDIATLYYPDDQGREAQLRTRIADAIARREFVPAASAGRLLASDLVAWTDCPHVPVGSPLRYWLPAFMHERTQAELPVEHWLQFDLWALREAAYLLCGRSPLGEREFASEIHDAGSAVSTMYRRLKDATIDGTLYFMPFGGQADRTRVRAADAVAWATARAIDIPDALRSLMRENADATRPDAAEPTPQGAGGSIVRWTDELIAQAREYRDNLQAKGARDYTAQTAAKYGVSPTRLRKLLHDDDPDARVSASPWPSVPRSRGRKG
jgi:hypothetical protein